MFFFSSSSSLEIQKPHLTTIYSSELPQSSDHVNANDLESQFENIRKKLKLDPKNLHLLQKKCSLLKKLENPEEALECANFILELDPINQKALLIKGKIYFETKQLVAAKDCFTLGLKQNQSKSKLLEALASVNKKLTEAENEYKIAIENFNKGEYLLSKDRINKALEIHPFFPECHFHMAKTLIKLKKFKEALVENGRFLDLESKAAKGYAQKGEILIEMGEISDAKDAFEEGVLFDPGNEDCRKALENLKGRKISENRINQNFI